MDDPVVYCLSSSGFGLAVGILLQAGDFAVGIRHELLEHIIEGLGLLFHRLGGTRTGRPVILCPGRSGAVVIAAVTVLTGTVKALSGAVILGPLGCGLGPADGQIDLAVFQTDDHDLDVLTFLQMVMDIIDIGMGDLGDMYHTGLILRQRNERAEFGDGFDFAFYDCTNC